MLLPNVALGGVRERAGVLALSGVSHRGQRLAAHMMGCASVSTVERDIDTFVAGYHDFVVRTVLQDAAPPDALLAVIYDNYNPFRISLRPKAGEVRSSLHTTFIVRARRRHPTLLPLFPCCCARFRATFGFTATLQRTLCFARTTFLK